MKPIKTLLQDGEYAEDVRDSLPWSEKIEDKIQDLERHAVAMELKQNEIISALNELIDNRK